MIDPLSERLELVEQIRSLAQNGNPDEAVRLLAHHDAAVRERTLEEVFKAQCWMCRQDAYIFFDEKTLHFHHKDGSVCGADRIRVTFAALKTPQPEVSK